MTDNPKPGQALLPADLLHPGETPLHIFRPSLWFVFLYRGFWHTLLLILLILMVLARQQEIVIFALLSLSLSMGLNLLHWLNKVYVLTDQRAIVITGLTKVTTFIIPRDRLQHTAVTRHLAEQLLGLGSVHLSSAGTDGTDITWLNIRNPYAIQKSTTEIN